MSLHRLYPWEVCGLSHEHEQIELTEHVLAIGGECGCPLPHVESANPPAYDEDECVDCQEEN